MFYPWMLVLCVCGSSYIVYIPCGIRWENCIAGCYTVPIWRLNVHLCIPLDSCSEPKRGGYSTWFHFCNIHAGFNAGKLLCISIDGSLIFQSWELHADCFCSLLGIPSAPHSNQCMLWILIPKFLYLYKFNHFSFSMRWYCLFSLAYFA